MFTDLAAFVQDHQRHGQLVGDASEPGSHGWPKGFEMWEEAEEAGRSLRAFTAARARRLT